MTPVALCRLVLALVALAPLASGQINIYSSGCSGILPTPQISHSGSLVPFELSTITLTGAPPNALCVLFVGTSNTDAMGNPVAFEFPHVPGVQPGCTLDLLPNVLATTVFADPTGQLNFSFFVKTGLGPDLYFQFGVLESEAPVSATLSPALEMHIPLVVDPSLGVLHLGAANEGEAPATGSVTLTNTTQANLSIENLVIFDGDASDFGAALAGGASLPHALLPGEDVDVDISFSPTFMGTRHTMLRVEHTNLPAGFEDPTVELFGFGLGVPGDDLRVNAGGELRADGGGQMWIADVGFGRGNMVLGPDPISGAFDQDILAEAREAQNFSYALPVVDADYRVTLHFAETVHQGALLREFDVVAEGQLVVDDLDLFALVGHDVAHSETFEVTVADGNLALDFSASRGFSTISAIELERLFPLMAVSPPSLDFSAVAQGNAPQLMLSIDNAGTEAVSLQTLTMSVDEGSGADFSVEIDGNTYFGDSKTIAHAVGAMVPAGGSLPALVTFTPSEHMDNDIELEFIGLGVPSVFVDVVGTGGSAGHPFLHVVIEDTGVIVDYDSDGNETVLLDGSLSHTHEPGKVLTAWNWTEGVTPLGSGQTLSPSFPVGGHTVTLTIEDDNVPAESLPGDIVFSVSPITAVPGVLANEYGTGATAPAALLDSLPSVPDHVEALESLRIGSGQTVGSSNLTTNVIVQLLANVEINTRDAYEFTLTGGVDTRLFVDGGAYIGPLVLGAGSHSIEARFALDSVLDLPIEVSMAPDMMPPATIPAEDLSHDETSVAPTLSFLTAEGSTLGGNLIILQGFGFFPFDQVDVNWGAQTLTELDFLSIGPSEISFLSPPHSAGLISVSVTTPNGTSGAQTFTYSEDGPPPIDFDLFQDVAFVWNPTSIAWGPDGRLYVGSRQGRLAAIEFDEDYNVVSQALYDGVVSLIPARESTGIAFNPYDPSSPVRVYMSHAELFAQGGGAFAGEAPYGASISYVEGPNFNAPVTIISGLPVSNHDHTVNGMQFDNNGDLLIAVGGNTNAGVKSTPIGDIPESPLSGAIIMARTSDPGFDGAVTYEVTDTMIPTNDQVLGEVSSQTGGDLSMHASGIRNPYDLLLATNGQLYATDNGPNGGFGPRSTGLTTQGGEVSAPDELLHVEYGVYYGHANRARGRSVDHENIWRDTAEPSIPGKFRQAISVLSSSTNGIDEYRATTFGNQLRGQLLVQRWNSHVSAVELSADGRSVLGTQQLVPPQDPSKGLSSLDVRAGPGGAILGVDYTKDDVNVMVPDDASVAGLTAVDIFPWRGVATGGTPFVIGGHGFGTLGNTSVTIGGMPATLTSVSAKRVHGITPASPSPSTQMLDVTITVGPEQATISEAFRYLFVPAGNEPGRFEALSSLPGFASMGEVAAGVINGKIYIMGDDTPSTQIYEVATDSWTTGAARLHPGDHHAAEVFDGKLYLFGGIGGGSPGKVQIYDPLLDSWSLGAAMPWLGGSSNTAVIDGLIYVAGGFVNGLTTTTEMAAYDPLLDSWSAPLAAMVDGRNHAASGTDGTRLWVFGGRGPGSGDANVVANGFADVQVYDPVLDTWDSSNLGGSTLVPLPIGRGGMGKAVWYRGEFYVFGGETLTGPGAVAGNVYDRVDVYDPATDSWRLEAALPTARHGIFPVLYESRMFILAGGQVAGHSHSTVAESFTRQ